MSKPKLKLHVEQFCNTEGVTSLELRRPGSVFNRLVTRRTPRAPGTCINKSDPSHTHSVPAAAEQLLLQGAVDDVFRVTELAFLTALRHT